MKNYGLQTMGLFNVCICNNKQFPKQWNESNTILIKKGIIVVTIQAMGSQPSARQLVLCDPRPHFELSIQYTIKITQ
jgi:hypothetical protein